MIGASVVRVIISCVFLIEYGKPPGGGCCDTIRDREQSVCSKVQFNSEVDTHLLSE